MILIGISGKKKSGKNTVANFIGSLSARPVTQLAFATNLKIAVAKLMKISVVELELNKDLYRGLLQWYGTEYAKTKWGDDYWVKKLGNEIMVMDCPVIVITDVRFKLEADFIKDCGGVIVRVQRSEIEHSFTGKIWTPDTHPSEVELDNYKFDYTIPNNDTLDSLSAITRQFLQQIKLPLKQ